MDDSLSIRLTSGALVVAPLLLIVSTTLFVTGGAGMNNSAPAGAVMVWAMIAFAVGLLGVTRHLAISATRGAALLRVLVVVGCAGGIGFGVDAMHAALTGGTNLLDLGGIAVVLGLAIPGALFWTAVAATGFAAGRAGMIGRGATALIVLGAVLFPVSRMPNIAALAIVADVLLLIGLAALSAALVGRAGQRHPAPAA
jgi:hypothetical protein